MLLYSHGSRDENLSSQRLREAIVRALDKLGPKKKVLILPPDITRVHSRAGELTGYVWEYYGKTVTDIMPALGTHNPMTPEEISEMFGSVPLELFREHDWRSGLVTLGEVPSEFVRDVSGGAVDYPWPAQVDRLLVEGGFDLIVSIGQVVPHEVVGMANHNKNVFIGTGGQEGINKSHFLGAVVGMEKIMGRADTPVRRMLNYASSHFGDKLPQIVYLQTVVGRSADGSLAMRGFYVGDDVECFELASSLSLKVNFEMLDKPIDRTVVHLDPAEFRSTWLGNKSIYRTRMAMADGGELIVLAPGVKEFGEDSEIDRLIRKYGYVGTPEVLRLVRENEDLRGNLSAAAHLIHGSSEGRFAITYCPGALSREEIEGVNFGYADIDEMMKLYNPKKLKEGYNTMPDGSLVYYISNPALGLWAHRDRFEQS